MKTIEEVAAHLWDQEHDDRYWHEIDGDRRDDFRDTVSRVLKALKAAGYSIRKVTSDE